MNLQTTRSATHRRPSSRSLPSPSPAAWLFQLALHACSNGLPRSCPDARPPASLGASQYGRIWSRRNIHTRSTSDEQLKATSPHQHTVSNQRVQTYDPASIPLVVINPA